MPLLTQATATRMHLQRLKKRTVLAKRGHKLLKDKQEELIRQMMLLLKGIRELREEVEKELQDAIRKFLFARASMEPASVEEAFLIPTKTLTLEIDRKHVMNVSVPVFREVIEGDILSYGFASTSPELDSSLMALDRVLKRILELAEREKSLALLADEIDRTRRRVNALEYVLIPELQDAVRSITMKLAEMERSTLSQLMKIKDIIRAHGGTEA
jgi:V/A-type H+-transporting ATPase subunit D